MPETARHADAPQPAAPRPAAPPLAFTLALAAGLGLAAANLAGCHLLERSPATEDVPVAARPRHPGPVAALSVTSALVVTGGSDGTMQLLDRGSGKRRGSLAVGVAVRDLALTPSGNLIAELGADAKLRLWDRATKRATFTADASASRTVALSGDGRFVLTGGDAVRIWETGSERLLFSQETPRGTGALSHDGTRVATVSGREVKIYDTFAKTLLHAVALEDSAIIYSLAFSPSGRLLAAGGDSVVFVVDVATGEALHELTRHTGYVSSIRFDPLGERFVSVSQSAALVWDAREGELVRRLNADAHEITAVAFGPDGSVYTGSHDGTIRRWSVQTGAELPFGR